jgi:phospholipid/cholesterol/gamma-HCH transport system substrate-binding protein
MRARKLTALLLAIALAGCGAAVAADLAQEDAGALTLTVTVEQAPNLFEGGRVMVRGVQVGSITDVEPTSDGVDLTMQIDEGVRIPADTKVAVIPITLIADRYVQLSPYEDGPEIEDGAHIDVADTSIPAELDEVLGELKGLVDAFKREPGQKRGPLADLIRAADKSLDGREESLAGALENSSDVLTNLATSHEDITSLIQNLDQLFVTLANSSSEIGLVNERFALVATALADDQDNIAGVIDNLEFLSTQASSLVTESGEDLGASFGRLEKTLNVILEHQDELIRGARWTNAIAQALGETTASGRGKYAYTGKQGAVGSSRARYNYRIDQRDTIACRRIRAHTDSQLAFDPTFTEEDILRSALAFIPDEYDDDVEWLIAQLIRPCSVFGDGDQSGLDRDSRRIIREIADEVGEDALMDMLGQWLIGGLAEDAP